MFAAWPCRACLRPEPGEREFKAALSGHDIDVYQPRRSSVDTHYEARYLTARLVGVVERGSEKGFRVLPEHAWFG